MLRCSVDAREVLLERAPVDEIGARAGTQRHARDRRLALAGRAVARAGGEVDRGGGDRLGERPPPSSCARGLGGLGLVLDGVGVLVASLRRGRAGRRPRGRCPPRGARPARPVSRAARAPLRPRPRPAPRRRGPRPPALPRAARPRRSRRSRWRPRWAPRGPRLRPAPRRPRQRVCRLPPGPPAAASSAASSAEPAISACLARDGTACWASRRAWPARRLRRRALLVLLVGHQASISKGCGFWATCGCSGPA